MGLALGHAVHFGRDRAETGVLELGDRLEAFGRSKAVGVGRREVGPGRFRRAFASGMKSQAVLSEGCGMPGVSGDENARTPPISGAFAKLPAVVP